ncbi:MAG: matrixin family metalloprotease [Armatimonadetes bacterium]|nr:matrixin family metalloprotease [Armatimonadota bacterium]
MSKYLVLASVFAVAGAVGFQQLLASNLKSAKKNECISMNPKDYDAKTFTKLVKGFMQDPKATGQNALAVACFAEGTDPAYVAAFQQALEQSAEGAWPGAGSRYFTGTRWNTPHVANGTAGQPITLTWSFVPDGTTITSTGASDNGGVSSGSTLFATMDAAFASAGGRATWIAQFEKIFARWSQVTGITYVRVTSGGNDWDSGASWGTAGNDTTIGDLRISMRNIDGASGSNVLAYNYFPQSGDMVIDSSNIASYSNAANGYRFLRNVLSHEHGHGMGINHVCPVNASKLMEPFVNTGFDTHQQDDIRAAQSFYGDPYEPNNNVAEATVKPVLGTYSSASGLVNFGNIPLNPSAGQPDPINTSIMSLHPNGPDVDLYRFTVTNPTSVVFTTTPVGSTYLNGPQNSNGSCTAGTNFDALNVANLNATLLGTDGATVLSSATDTGTGVAESTVARTLAAGTYFVRVNSAAVSSTQGYKCSLNLRAPQAITGALNVGPFGRPMSSIGATAQFFTPGGTTPLLTVPLTFTSGTNYLNNIVGLNAGTYDIRFNALHWLSNRVNNVVVPAFGSFTQNVTLLNGDCNGDEEVGASDFDTVVANFGNSSTSGTTGDVDGDGEVGSSDFDIVVANFGESGT